MNNLTYLKLDLKRHPRSANSADVMVGFLKLTRLHITTFVLNCNTKRHQINQEIALTIKFWLLAVGWSSLLKEPSPIPDPGARKFAPGLTGCVIMDVPCRILLIQRKETPMSARVLAIMLILFVLAASQPAQILHRLLEAGAALLKCFF
jgi:hypothetical protein